MDIQESLKKKRDLLKDEHRDIDTMISDLLRESIVNQLAVQRLKKKKLLVRDQIARINQQLLPDILA